MKEIAPGIVVFDDVINGYETLIQDIEDSVKNGVVSWSQAYVVNATDAPVINTESRNTDTLTVPYSDNPVENDLNPRTAFDSTLSKIFYDSFSPKEKQYCGLYNIEVYRHETYSVLRYGVGQKFVNHIDDHRNYPRTISLVYYLNDNYSGGEISFPRFGIKHKPKANQLIMFPSNYIYNHSVSEVTDGVRYCVVSWGR